MNAYGFGFTPSGVVYTNLKVEADKSGKKMTFSVTPSKIANVYIFDSLSVLEKSINKLPDLCSVIVCDTPVLLMDQTEIKLVDFHQLPGRAWQFLKKQVEYGPLYRRLVKPDSGKVKLENPGDFLATAVLVKSQGALSRCIEHVTSQLDPKKHKDFFTLLAKSLTKKQPLDLSNELFEKVPKLYLNPLRRLLEEDLDALHSVYTKVCSNKSVDNLLLNTQYTKADFTAIKKRA